MMAADSICEQTWTCQLKSKKGWERCINERFHDYLINSDIYAGSLQSAIFSACYSGKTYNIIGGKITFLRKTNKLSVLDLWVVNLAFVACGKI